MTIEETTRYVTYRGHQFYSRLSDCDEMLRFRVQISAKRTEGKLNACFIGFNSYADLSRWIVNNPDLSIHEITNSGNEGCIQRIFFDIDADKKDYPDLNETVFKQVCEMIYASVEDVLKKSGITDDNAERIVLNGSHAKKFGIHLIYKFAYIQVEHNKCFIAQVKSGFIARLDAAGLPPHYLNIIDEQVYKKNGSLRIHLSPKPENAGGAVYKIENGNNDRFDYRTLILYQVDPNTDKCKMNFYSCGDCILTQTEATFVASADMPGKVAAAVAAIEALKDSGLTIRRQNKNVLELWTNHSKPCYVCDKKHDSDNCYAVVFNSCALVFCRRTKLPNGKDMNKILVKFEDFGTYKEPEPEPITAAAMPEPALFFETNTKYVEGLNSMMAAHNTVYLRSDLGSGKSVAFTNLVKNQMEKVENFCCIIITYRINLAHEILARNPSFESYTNLPHGPIRTSKHPRIIIQYESFHRLYLDREVDFCFIDEGASLLQQTQSGLNKQRAAINMSMFDNILCSSKKLLVCDALLSIDHMKTIDVFRNDPKSVFWINNGEKWAPTVQYIENAADWRIRLMDDIKSGKRLYITLTHGEIMVKALEEHIRATIGAHIRILSIYGGKEENPDLMAAINTEFVKYDVIIASPCLSAGVSFDVRGHFDKVYSYIDIAGPTSVDIIQSFRRVRHLKDNEIVICDVSSDRNLPATFGDVKKYEEKRLYENCEEFATEGIPVSIRGTEYMFRDPDAATLRFVLSVKALINRARRSIKSTVRAFLVSQNATFKDVIRLDENRKEAAKEDKKIFTKTKKTVKKDLYTNIATAELLSDDEYDELKKLKRMSAANKAKLEKFQLSRKYNIIQNSNGVWVVHGLHNLQNEDRIAQLMNPANLNTFYNAQYRELTQEETTMIDNERRSFMSDIEAINARFITKRHILINKIRDIVERGENVQSLLAAYMLAEQINQNPSLIEFSKITEKNCVKTANDIISAYGYRITNNTNQKYKFKDYLHSLFTVLHQNEPMSELEAKAEKPIVWLL